MNANQIREMCEHFSVRFNPIITPALEARLSQHSDLLDSGLDAYSFRVLVACEIDELPADEWLKAMQSVVREFERETRVRDYLLRTKGQVREWLN